MDDNQNELKTLIEPEKRNLLFYSLHWDILVQNASEKEFEKQIDQHFLDRLLLLLKLKEKKEFSADLKNIYNAPQKEVALLELDMFEQKWGTKYPDSLRSCGLIGMS